MTLDGRDLEDPDDEPYRPWLPPEDRLWRHPSEISSPSPRSGWLGRSGRWTLLAVAGAVGVIVVSGLVVIAGGRPTGGVAAGARRSLPSRSASPGVATTLAYRSSDPAAPGVTTASVRASQSFMSLVSRVLPSVVAIRVSSPHGSWRGSGVLLRSDGMVLTTQRLLVGASSITVVTSDGRTRSGSIVGTDPDTDVAVVRFPARDLTAASFAHDQTLTPGQLAVAVSAGQRGSKPAVSIGTLQALGEQGNLPGAGALGVVGTDAPLSSDEEGAPLVGQDGQVIGMAAISPSPGSASTGSAPSGSSPSSTKGGQPLWLATPGALVWDTAQQLMATGHVVRAWLGIEGSDAGSPAGPNQPAGAKVTSVSPASPAAAAGLQVGDVIQAINGRPLSSMLDLRAALRRLSPGTKVVLGVQRGSQAITLPATLASQ